MGLAQLDEPKLNQSKRAEIEAVLKEIGVGKGREYKNVHSIKEAHKHPAEITSWVSNIEKILKIRHAATVTYSGNMPDVDSLMQAWDPEFEQMINGIELPEGEVDIPIEELLKYTCALLDIPINTKNKENSLIESCHMLFNLYSSFKQNQHFQRGNDNNIGMGGANNIQSMDIG